MTRLMFSGLSCCCLLIAFGGTTSVVGESAWADDSKAKQTIDKTEKKDEKKTDDEVELNDQEKAFKKLLTKAKLVGNFTITGRDTDKLATEEYTITRINKTPQKDLWVFMARVKYGKNDYTVPLTLNVKWADDTPMITLSDLTILGQGPFSARVLFHQNKYAGTWSHGEVSGHLFGTIEPAGDAKRTDGEEKKEKEKDKSVR